MTRPNSAQTLAQVTSQSWPVKMARGVVKSAETTQTLILKCTPKFGHWREHDANKILLHLKVPYDAPFLSFIFHPVVQWSSLTKNNSLLFTASMKNAPLIFSFQLTFFNIFRRWSWTAEHLAGGVVTSLLELLMRYHCHL